jgi:hypothetical protein
MADAPSAIFSEAAAEYRAADQKPVARRDNAHAPATEITQENRRSFVFETLFEAIRAAIGAQVAIGAGDFDLAQACLGNMTLAVKALLRTWDEHETDRRAECQKSEGRAA